MVYELRPSWSMEGVVDRMILACPNGDLVDIRTGIVVNYSDFYPFPSLSKDARTLLRYFDGVSAEPLGSIPKVIAISRAEQRLLSKIRPWRWFKYSTRMDYLRLLDRINKHRLSTYMSILMKNLRADPTSTYNTLAYRTNHMMGCREAWKDPIAIENKSIAITESWIKRREKFGPSGFTEDGLLRLNSSGQKRPLIWATRRERYPPHGVKNPQAYSKSLSKGQKNRWVWGRLAQVMEMLFDGIVDEDAKAFSCLHCNRVFLNKIGVGVHTRRAHGDIVITG